MKISNKIISKFQEGGPAPDPASAQPSGPDMAPPAGGGAPMPEEGGGADPIMQIAELAMQALQAQDCEAAMATCEAFMALVEGGGGGGEPTPGPQEGAPVFKKGGILAKRVKA